MRRGRSGYAAGMSEARSERTDVAEPQGRLTPKQAALVEAIAGAASRGKTVSREQAGTAAGYGSGEVARVGASRALSSPAVRAALTRRMRELMQVDAALAVLRHLELNAKSERVQLDAALAGMRLGGLDAGDQGQTGAAVAVQIVFRTDAGTLLTQAQHMPPQPQVISHIPEAEHSLAEGEHAASQAEGVGGGVEPETAKQAPPSKTSARRSQPTPPHNSPPKKSRPAKKSPRKKSRKVGGKAAGKALGAVVVSGGVDGAARGRKAAVEAPVRRLNLSDAERLRRSEAAKARNAARAAAKGGADG
jgi:hypothetical protein